MKRIVLVILCLCILLLSMSCGNTTKDLLDESEYFVYENGDLYLDPKDMTGEYSYRFQKYGTDIK